MLSGSRRPKPGNDVGTIAEEHQGPLSFNAYGIIMQRKGVAGSIIGGIRETQEMLDFCAEHRIVSTLR